MKGTVAWTFPISRLINLLVSGPGLLSQSLITAAVKFIMLRTCINSAKWKFIWNVRLNCILSNAQYVDDIEAHCCGPCLWPWRSSHLSKHLHIVNDLFLDRPDQNWLIVALIIARVFPDSGMAQVIRHSGHLTLSKFIQVESPSFEVSKIFDDIFR